MTRNGATAVRLAACAGTAATAYSGMCVSCGTMPRHAAQAEARAEPVDQMRQLFGVIVRRPSPVCTGSLRSVTSAESRTMS